MVFHKSIQKKNEILLEWQNAQNGCFICSYEAFKTVVKCKRKPEQPAKQTKKKKPEPSDLEQWINESKNILLNAPDIVVCDEGHALKNSATVLNRLVSKIKTQRRIILSGTPLQNNLQECMRILFILFYHQF